jgi:replicative DNA helicase
MLETLSTPKTLPHSEESERAVLASILIDPRYLTLVSGRLRPEDFYFERHQLIYQAMIDLGSEMVEADVLTLQGKLEQKGWAERAGGLGYLTGLDVDLPDLGRADSYVEIVKERSLRRRLIDTSSTIIRDCLDGGLDAASALGKAEGAILALGEEAIQRGFTPIGKVLEEIVVQLEDHPGSGIIGVPTGFIDLDQMTQGLNRGNLIIVAGRPGMGKTSFALNVAQHVAVHDGNPVAIFSLEMSAQELAMRVLCSVADVPFYKLRSGHLSSREMTHVFQTAQMMSTSPLYIDDSPNPNLLEVASKARRLKAEKGLELLVIDYLQLMSAGGKFENRNLEIGTISRTLKQLAKDLAIPVIALSQLSRNPERRGSDHRPQLSDLRESGNIEQDADIVAFIYRDEVYHKDNPENQNRAELILAKHRNGETGTVHLAFFGENTSFRNLDRRDWGGGAPG